MRSAAPTPGQHQATEAQQRKRAWLGNLSNQQAREVGITKSICDQVQVLCRAISSKRPNRILPQGCAAGARSGCARIRSNINSTFTNLVITVGHHALVKIAGQTSIDVPNLDRILLAGRKPRDREGGIRPPTERVFGEQRVVPGIAGSVRSPHISRDTRAGEMITAGERDAGNRWVRTARRIVGAIECKNDRSPGNDIADTGGILSSPPSDRGTLRCARDTKSQNQGRH